MIIRNNEKIQRYAENLGAGCFVTALVSIVAGVVFTGVAFLAYYGYALLLGVWQ